MALLQLAESPYSHLAESKAISKYIFIPAGMFNQTEDTYVREDFFDSLTDDEYQEVITALAPYQNQGMSAIGLAVATGLKAVAPIVKTAISKRAERVASGTAKQIFKPGGKLAGLKDKVAGAINKLKDQPSDQTKKIPIDVNANVGDTALQFQYGQPSDIPFFTKYKTPLLVGGGLVGAFLLYKAFFKK